MCLFWRFEEKKVGFDEQNLTLSYFKNQFFLPVPSCRFCRYLAVIDEQKEDDNFKKKQQQSTSFISTPLWQPDKLSEEQHHKLI